MARYLRATSPSWFKKSSVLLSRLRALTFTRHFVKIYNGVTIEIKTGVTPTFEVFVERIGGVPFDPATHRSFVRFKEAGGMARGSTSVVVLTE